MLCYDSLPYKNIEIKVIWAVISIWNNFLINGQAIIDE